MAKARRHPAVPLFPAARFDRLTWMTFGLLLAVVLARASMTEFLREPFTATPGSDAAPRATGPAASVGLDLLCCVPALLLLGRRAVGKATALAAPLSFSPLAALTAWMLLSATWAADKFAAIVTACHWTAAVAVLWAAAQLVRDWTKLRLAAAMVFGLLPVYVAQGFEFRFVEHPQTLKTFEENRAKFLSQNGMEEGSFAAKQFEAKLKLAEAFGFFTSPNTFGGITSLLLVLAVGMLVQHVVDRDAMRWAGPTLAVVIVTGLALLAMTRSRGAATTLVMCLIGFAAIGRWRAWLAAHARAAFFSGGVIVCGALVAVIGLGVARGRLPTSTLTFRWQYWVGAAAVFKQHLLAGVGWSNFGLYYLAHRLPSAPEEIKDPHDLLVKFFTELGLIGGLLLIAWLVRLWWDLTRPAVPPEPTPRRDGEPQSPGVLKFVAAVVGGALLIYLVTGYDWSRDVPETLLLRLMFVGAMVLGPALVALRSLESQAADDRPAPWVLYAMLLGIGGMLVHNLIDFSLFETGPMIVFALLVGCALGVRGTASSLVAQRRARIVWVMVVALWLAGAVGIWAPLVQAERDADAGDDAMRATRLSDAEAAYARANADAHRWNADYAYRAGLAAATAGADARAIEHFHAAIAENPQDGRYDLTLVQALLRAGPPTAAVAAEIQSVGERAMALNPNDAGARIQFADALAKAGRPTEARAQYEAALRYNDLLNRDEAKRLTESQIADIRKKIEAMK